jgi:hypothetical protein
MKTVLVKSNRTPFLKEFSYSLGDRLPFDECNYNKLYQRVRSNKMPDCVGVFLIMQERSENMPKSIIMAVLLEAQSVALMFRCTIGKLDMQWQTIILLF